MKYFTAPIVSTRGASARAAQAFMADPLFRAGVLEKKNRLLSVVCYFGMAPLLWASGMVRQRNRLVNHHLFYSLAFSFTLMCALVFDLVTDWIQYWLTVSVWNPTMAEFRAVPMWILCRLMVYGLILSVSLFGLAWFISLSGAWRGKTPKVPLISSIASRYQAVRFGMYFALLVQFVVLLLVGLGIRTARISKSLSEKGVVYILYTQGGYIPLDGPLAAYTPPRWAVTMAFYPLVRAGMERFGDGSVSVLPLSEDTFNAAVQNGRFIFVASHGGASPGAFTVSNEPSQEYFPADVVPEHVGEGLQYVYFAGCWTGDLEGEWRQVLGLEDATMFPRLSFVEEHMLWVWFRSPAVIAGLN